MSFLFHGHNKKQCYYEASCLVCLLHLSLKILFTYPRRKTVYEINIAKTPTEPEPPTPDRRRNK